MNGVCMDDEDIFKGLADSKPFPRSINCTLLGASNRRSGFYLLLVFGARGDAASLGFFPRGPMPAMWNIQEESHGIFWPCLLAESGALFCEEGVAPAGV